MADEIIRADRFYFAKDRDYFIAARGVLRTILGRYLGVDPGQVHFRYNSYGKPSLDHPPGEDALNFNLSHSAGLALYAFTCARRVGIDLEYMRADVDYEQLARRNFSLYEKAVFQALPPEQKRQAFFNCWTRKEAYVKARGEGLSIALEQFDVSLKPGEPARLLGSREDPGETAQWSLQELAPGSGYAAALAVEEGECRLSLWQWNSSYAG